MKILVKTVIGAASLALISTTALSQTTFVRMVAGPAGGSWYPFGAKIMEVLQRDVSGIRTSNGPGGGVGNVRAVDKGNINDRDLAVITGVRPDGQGALVRHIAERTNIPPSSEAVEMVEIDQPLPSVDAPDPTLKGVKVPVVRSKLHGHRGVRAFDRNQVEYAPLDPRYHRYLVTCATEAQAEGVRRAFARSARPSILLMLHAGPQGRSSAAPPQSRTPVP